jgi:putative ABC transport system substrate-binding protein
MWYSAVGCLVMLTLSLLAAPLTAGAQPRGKISLIGVLEPGAQPPRTPCLPAFQQGLRDLGYVEGQNVTFVYRYAEEQPDRLPALAAELIQLAPDVIWLHANAPARAAKQATTAIPIIIAVGNAMVEQGLVESLARPGGNLTGLELRDVELMGKQLELFKEAVPTLSRVAVLVDPAMASHAGVPTNIKQEAQALHVQLQRVEAGAPEGFETAFAAIVQGGADALMILSSPFFAEHRQRLMTLARRHRLPTMSVGRHYTEAGSLLGYGAYVGDLCQRSAVFVDKILKGTKPADLPVEQSDKFYLSVNLKTAEALGLTLSPLFLSQADEVLR